MENHIQSMAEWVQEDLGTFIKLTGLGVHLPQPIEAALPLVFERILEKALVRVLDSPERTGELEDFFVRSRELGYPLTKERIWEIARGRIGQALRDLVDRPDSEALLAAIQGIIRTCRQWEVPVTLWDIQNHFLDACRESGRDRFVIKEIYRVFSREIEIPPEVIAGRLHESGI
jgi:hypothetical protein